MSPRPEWTVIREEGAPRSDKAMARWPQIAHMSHHWYKDREDRALVFFHSGFRSLWQRLPGSEWWVQEVLWLPPRGDLPPEEIEWSILSQSHCSPGATHVQEAPEQASQEAHHQRPQPRGGEPPL